MSKRISTKDLILVLFLVALIIGASWYMLFYTPLQDEIASINSQTAKVQDEITLAQTKLSKMKSMQDEIDAILAQPADQITEIAPYDNATVVIAQLNGILSSSMEYNLSFRDPEESAGGTVRRVINMNFTCEDYASARKIIQSLSKSHWRCVVNSVTAGVPNHRSADGEVADLMSSTVQVTAQITFFESTHLS